MKDSLLPVMAERHVCPSTPGTPCGAPGPPSTPAPKLKKRAVYTMKLKKKVVDYAEKLDNNHEAGRFYKLDESLKSRTVYTKLIFKKIFDINFIYQRESWNG